jgi:hypothetical protein
MRVKALYAFNAVGWSLLGIVDLYRRHYFFGSAFILMAAFYAMSFRRKAPNESAVLKSGIGSL